MIRALYRVVFAFLLLNLAVPALHAQQTAPNQRSFNQQVEKWRRALDQVQTELARNFLTRERLDKLRGDVESIRQAAEQARAEASSARKPLGDQLAALGPAPAKGQPPEPTEVARQRRQLNEALALYDTRVKQAELALARTAGLEQDIARIGNEQIAQRLLAREAPPLSLPALGAAARELGDVLAALASAPIEWWRSSSLDQLAPVNLVWLGLVLLLAFGAGWPLRNWLLRRFGHAPDLAEPSYARRALAAGAEGVARGLLPAIGLLAVAAVLLGEEIVTGLLAQMVWGALFGAIFFSLTSALARAALSPEAPNWRIVPFGAESSRILARRLTVLAAIAGIALGTHIATRELEPGARELFNLLDLVFDTLVAGLTLTLLQRRLWQPDTVEAEEQPQDKPSGPKPGGRPEEPPPMQWSWPLLRLVVSLALLAVPVLALAGYAILASHIVSRVVLTGVLIGAFLLVRALIRELLGLFIAPESSHSARLRQVLALTDQGSGILIFWLGVTVDLVLALLGLALALRLWGVPGDAIGFWASGALKGIVIGNLHLSIGEIALSILVFVAFWTGTRVLQRLLRDKLLPQTRLDPGVRHSLSAVVGYIGFTVALAFAISTLGLSLSNIAIIAGALSVGIGFGLQNIVNNFVSGLILLIERPIKVGDWIVVGQNQGFVTRISVRATEIRTFEHASVIIPNSELLSSAVVNWTHRDKYGRIDVKVGVAYGSDTDKVRDILLACARQHRLVVGWPNPHVLFRSFGDSALEFELRAYISDIAQHMHVASDLHFAVNKALRAAGIEIPFPQRDVTVRNVEAIARAFAAARSGEPLGPPLDTEERELKKDDSGGSDSAASEAKSGS